MSFDTNNVTLKQLKSTVYKNIEQKRFAIQNTMMFYARTQPVLKMKKKGNPSRFFQDREYTATLLINKEMAKALKGHFTGKVIIDRVDNEDFEEQFKVPAPSDDSTFYMLKLTRHASYKEGEFMSYVHGMEAGLLEDNKLVKYPMKKITSKDGDEYSGSVPDVMIGSGTIGDVILNTYTYTDTDSGVKETKPVPVMFVVRELVEVVLGSGNNAIHEEELDDLGYDSIADYEADGHGTPDEESNSNSESQIGNSSVNEEENDDDDDWDQE